MVVNTAGWHDRQARISTLEQDAIPTLNGSRKPEPLFFRANSGDCVTFASTNLLPGVLNLDDFQILRRGQLSASIHLVKFDVTLDGRATDEYETEHFRLMNARTHRGNNASATGGGKQIYRRRRIRFRRRKFLGAQTTVNAGGPIL